MSDRPDILEKIAALNRAQLANRRKDVPEAVLIRQAAGMPAAKSLYAALKRPGSVRIIAELKKASPSKGLIRADFRFEDFAAEYIDAGAAAISVLTEENFFMGSLEYLRKVARLAAATPVPVLRKDFIFDRYQIAEARAAGADAVLLIAELIPSDADFTDLLACARNFGMDALCEAHDPDGVRRLIRLGARIIGVNSRDLRSFATDISRTGELLKLIPPECAAVAESGIGGAADIAGLHADAYLVGELLMRHDSPGAKLRELTGGGHGGLD